MYYLYILESQNKKWRYIGITANIQNRIAEHGAGEVKSTQSHRPLKLIYQETLGDKTSARKREIFLKKNARARKELFEKLSGPIV